MGYWRALWILTRRDLRVRYSTSSLGYLWSVLEPLAMAAIYWFVFTQIFARSGVGESPYIVFLLVALLPWTWFNGTINDASRAFWKESRLVRSVRLPRTVWVNQLVLAKGIEFLLSLPVLALFVILTGTAPRPELLPLFLLGIALQTVATIGIGLIVAPLVVFFPDLERATKLVLRFMFFATPVIYGTTNLPAGFELWSGLNPLAGAIALYRAPFFPAQLDWLVVALSSAVALALLGLGLIVFRRCERALLKAV